MSRCCGVFDIGKGFVENLNGQNWPPRNTSRRLVMVSHVVDKSSKPRSQPVLLLSHALHGIGDDAVAIHKVILS